MAINIKQDPKTFYAYVRSKQRTKAVVGQLKRHDGSLTTSDSETAQLLNQHFSSVFTRENTERLPEPDRFFVEGDEHILSGIEVTEEGVERKLAALKPGKAPGPDHVHPRILKEFSKELAPGLTRLYERSLREGAVPGDWKSANVVPLHKGGSKCAVGNYRPVSLTSVICKVTSEGCDCNSPSAVQVAKQVSAWVHQSEVMLDQPSNLFGGRYKSSG